MHVPKRDLQIKNRDSRGKKFAGISIYTHHIKGKKVVYTSYTHF
jgi:hypothetical protein